jgi:hypothetical protein
LLLNTRLMSQAYRRFESTLSGSPLRQTSPTLSGRRADQNNFTLDFPSTIIAATATLCQSSYETDAVPLLTG